MIESADKNETHKNIHGAFYNHCTFGSSFFKKRQLIRQNLLLSNRENFIAVIKQYFYTIPNRK